MDIFSRRRMFPPVLNQIRDSVLSTASDGLTRVLTFTGSFSDRTSLLSHDSPPSSAPSQEAQETPAPTTTAAIGAFDLEAGAAPQATSRDDGAGPVRGQEGEGARDEPKRVAKNVQPVCLFAASASLVLFVNLPGKPGAAGTEHPALYSVNLAFICLSFFTSLGLSMYSIVARPGDPSVASVQKSAMVMAIAFVLVSFILRMVLMLPTAALESAWLLFFIFAGAAALYLSLAWKLGHGSPNSPDEDTSGADGAASQSI